MLLMLQGLANQTTFEQQQAAVAAAAAAAAVMWETEWKRIVPPPSQNKDDIENEYGKNHVFYFAFTVFVILGLALSRWYIISGVVFALAFSILFLE